MMIITDDKAKRIELNDKIKNALITNVRVHQGPKTTTSYISYIKNGKQFKAIVKTSGDYANWITPNFINKIKKLIGK